MSDNVPPLRRGIDIMPSPLAESPGLILRDPFRYTQAVLLIPSGWIPALALLNGSSTELELQETLTRASGGQFVRREDVQQFVQILRNHGFLESEEFHRLRDARQEEFRHAPDREPTHAGSAYSADADELTRQVAADEPRQEAADAHREQVGADDRGELEDAVADQIARHRAGDQLVDEPARGDEQDREKQRDRHGLSGPRRR